MIKARVFALWTLATCACWASCGAGPEAEPTENSSATAASWTPVPFVQNARRRVALSSENSPDLIITWHGAPEGTVLPVGETLIINFTVRSVENGAPLAQVLVDGASLWSATEEEAAQSRYFFHPAYPVRASRVEIAALALDGRGSRLEVSLASADAAVVAAAGARVSVQHEGAGSLAIHWYGVPDGSLVPDASRLPLEFEAESLSGAALAAIAVDDDLIWEAESGEHRVTKHLARADFAPQNAQTTIHVLAADGSRARLRLRLEHAP